ncbi:MAG TPA: UrcA family protein [Steroidobacteraceae bacterium]|nr:UrcA family protein [Steroidobacteraceae bacterium]
MNITNSNHPSTVRPLALVLILGLLASRAFSAEPGGITVKYGDLDLSTASGAHTLYSRIAGAARTVCGFEGTTLIDQAIWKGCYRGAISDAVAKVNSPMLTAVHTGRPVGPTVAMAGK